MFESIQHLSMCNRIMNILDYAPVLCHVAICIAASGMRLSLFLSSAGLKNADQMQHKCWTNVKSVRAQCGTSEGQV